MELRQKIDKILGTTLSFIMAVMVVNVLWQVFTRFVIGSPSSFTDELARYLMIWVGVLGAAYISGRNMHVAIDLLPTKLNKEGQEKLKIFEDKGITSNFGQPLEKTFEEYTGTEE